MLDAVDEVNNRQKLVLIHKIQAHFDGQLKRQDDRRVGTVVQAPHRRHPRSTGPGADRQACWQEGAERARARSGGHGQRARDRTETDCCTAAHPLDVLVGADALAINTEWGEFRNPDFAEMRRRMASPVIFDGRNLYEPEEHGGRRVHVLLGRSQDGGSHRRCTLTASNRLHHHEFVGAGLDLSRSQAR